MAVLLALSAAGGCSTSMTDMESVLSTPAGVPASPEMLPAYPAVHDLPVQRPALLSPEEQARLENDLAAARARAPRPEGMAASAAKKTSKKTSQKTAGDASGNPPRAGD
ncbi:MAG: hypothetical protein EPO23_03690 [Xanthobacteraceae bacterium]|nr:MAG: hypothetical protein EPO23_03690 [Xanthobacteraceae bacterium]